MINGDLLALKPPIPASLGRPATEIWGELKDQGVRTPKCYSPHVYSIASELRTRYASSLQQYKGSGGGGGGAKLYSIYDKQVRAIPPLMTFLVSTTTEKIPPSFHSVRGKQIVD